MNVLTVCLTSSRPLILSFFQGSSLTKFSTFPRPLFVKFSCVSLRNELIYTQRCDLHEQTKHPEVFLNYIAMFISSIYRSSMTRYFLNRLVSFKSYDFERKNATAK